MGALLLPPLTSYPLADVTDCAGSKQHGLRECGIHAAYQSTDAAPCWHHRREERTAGLAHPPAAAISRYRGGLKVLAVTDRCQHCGQYLPDGLRELLWCGRYMFCCLFVFMLADGKKRRSGIQQGAITVETGCQTAFYSDLSTNGHLFVQLHRYTTLHGKRTTYSVRLDVL